MKTAQRTITVLAFGAVLVLAIWAAGQPSRWRTIAAYQTGLAGRTHSQAHNLALAVRSINGKILPSGGEFSFNHAVGSWTAERGYVKAPVSYDGELIPAWGGGVCQASSTLYNAALLAGMDILERHRHRFPAKYVPPGQDAAVAQYDIDLRFRNPYAWPVKIEARIDGEHVYCRILSQRELGREISVEREIRQITSASEVVRSTSDGPSVRWKVINHGQPGLRVAVYRRVQDDSSCIRALVSDDTYPPMNKLVVAR